MHEVGTLLLLLLAEVESVALMLAIPRPRKSHAYLTKWAEQGDVQGSHAQELEAYLAGDW